MRTMSKVVMLVAMLLLSLVFAPTSHAALNAVGPVDPANGFPTWYQDSTGLSLAPCFDNNGFCAITMAAGPGFDPTQPMVFPLTPTTLGVNFPEEFFYFEADTFAGSFLYVSAIEGAFANAVQPGDQMVFARIRHRDAAAPAGTYTITHPYGVDTITVEAADVAAGRGLFFTEDIGIAPGIFTGALAGRVGPFLRNAGGLVTSPDGNIYIGNSVSPVAVTGPAVTSVTVAGPITGSATTFVIEGKVIGMSVSPTSIAFPVQRPAPFTSPAVVVTVSNLDSVNALTIASIVPQGTNAADFLVADVNCLTAPVAAGGSCTFNVTFSGAAAGPAARTASILISAALASVPKAAVTPVTGLIDAVAPTVTAHFPDVATQPGNVAITATFSEPMLESSITNTTFTVFSGATEVPGTRTFSTADNTMTFVPTAFFNPNEVITVAATTALTDIAGNGLASALTFSFTATAPDLSPPTIVSISPANNATGVRTDSVITVTFSEPMLGASITAGTIQVTSGGVAVPGTLTLNGAVATFTPTGALDFGAAYTVTVGTGALDLLRNALGTGQTVNFVANFQPAAPEVVSPANGATGVARPVVLTWKRSSDSDPQDVISYHLFLCNNPTFIGTAPNCILNETVTVAAAPSKGVYYASVGGGSMLFTLFGLGWAYGFKGRKKILLMIAVLAISGLFLVSCSKSDDDAAAPVSTDITHQVAGLSPNVTYYWKVEADDGKGGVTATRVMTFTTQ